MQVNMIMLSCVTLVLAVLLLYRNQQCNWNGQYLKLWLWVSTTLPFFFSFCLSENLELVVTHPRNSSYFSSWLPFSYSCYLQFPIMVEKVPYCLWELQWIHSNIKNYRTLNKGKHFHFHILIIFEGMLSLFTWHGFLTLHFRGLLFGLSEEQSKGAITTACRFLLIKAGGYI